MDSHDQKINDLTLSALIRILREIAFLGVIAFLAIELFSGKLSLDFTKLSATELVSLLLAFFSIALSAAFYFAATTQSNQFYDNVNEFSKDTAELLGRLDEQVKGIGGRQTELKDSIDKYYMKGANGHVEHAKEQVEVQAKAVEENLSEMIGGLLDKANLSEKEREAFKDELKKKDAELASLRDRMTRLSSNDERSIRRYTQRKIQSFGVEKALSLPIEEWAVPVLQLGPRAFLRDLYRLGFITNLDLTSPSDLTDAGRKMLLTALEQAVDEHGESS